MGRHKELSQKGYFSGKVSVGVLFKSRSGETTICSGVQTTPETKEE